MSEETNQVVWHGSVLLVTKPGQRTPYLELRPLGAWNGTSRGANEPAQRLDGLKLYSDPDKTFWRFTLRVPLTETEAKWQYTIPNINFLTDVSKEPSREFVVPASTDSMRIMFHSCNGFSVGTDLDFWTG